MWTFEEIGPNVRWLTLRTGRVGQDKEVGSARPLSNNRRRVSESRTGKLCYETGAYEDEHL
jgi:hypothetical protein